MKRVEGKVAIVTGGALGIGRAVCLELAKEGAKVAVTDIADDEGQKVVNEIKGFGGTAKYWHIDTANEDEVGQTFSDIAKEFGSIDVLVNNAGIAGVNKPTHEITKDEWDKVINVNVSGVFYCTKHAIPAMKKAGAGSIINLSSIYGMIGAADLPPYHASKGAVRLMSKNDALIYAKDKIRVNSVHPGFIWTPLVEQLGKESDEGVNAFRKQLDSLHPIGHVGESEDIAYGVLYLASDESKFVTGTELVIDGGYTAQ
ncbi:MULTISPECIES: SDR family NAD(P)-dependent oxidoreductase [Idiomarina]|uniref:SDR family NAD(P)-dependent oxidoreductase n=1 Tax=Idiomarina TaxID=135575 RepID=UPI0006C8D640|nr:MULTISPECIES: glucose 1-dehydrogenase [Idiomarina]KPD20667.1 short-chain dehydrogenase [Idiomarina abyssalis]MBP58281.1 3-oxoacyl-ACP reductase [Idiomarina sp.]SFT57182.1 NAD(P)-dependent dehydrogenase, short-chain alcohol dehydrogenase family [Idiomarina abyssalis]|tara:strand:- start:23274 stop:24044 length:771 start_codon:yes stop_codon:yes gene_type:complete